MSRPMNHVILTWGQGRWPRAPSGIVSKRQEQGWAKSPGPWCLVWGQRAGPGPSPGSDSGFILRTLHVLDTPQLPAITRQCRTALVLLLVIRGICLFRACHFDIVVTNMIGINLVLIPYNKYTCTLVITLS